MYMRFILFLIVTTIASSCSYLKKDKDKSKDAVARAYDKYLYTDDLEEVIKADEAKRDSEVVAKTYIDNWIHQQVVMHKA